MAQITTAVINFVGSATSNPLNIGSGTVIAIETPNSFTATTLKLQSASVFSDGSIGAFKDVYLVAADMSTQVFQFTVSDTFGFEYDLSGCFPAGSRVIRFVASTSITNSVTISIKEV